MQDPDGPGEAVPPKRPAILARAAILLGQQIRRLIRLLLARPLRGAPNKDASAGNNKDSAPLATRLVRGLCYRLLFAPILLALAAAALVFAGTHPSRQTFDADPRTHGVYYDPVAFSSVDGTSLEGWIVPMVDARMVMERQDRLLRSRFPAVVLVHDHGQSPQQMLSLVGPLHEEGMVVLVVGLRGQSAGAGFSAAGGVGQTFGLNESLDVLAAVNLLRRRAFIDPSRIAVLGVGTGANAALLAAEEDPGIAALVLSRPVESADAAIANLVGPKHRALRWMRPVCKWTFEVAYGVDADALNLSGLNSVMEGLPVLSLDDGGGAGPSTDPINPFTAASTQKIREFFRAELDTGRSTATRRSTASTR
jgi:hypothetical protein